MADNRNNGNNGVNAQPPPPQPNVQPQNAIFQAAVAQVDPVLTWLSDLPKPRRGVAEAVIWPRVYNCDCTQNCRFCS